MTAPKSARPQPPYTPTDLPGGPDRIIQICEELRERNSDGYLKGGEGGGILANIAGHNSLRVSKGTTCTPFTGTVIGVAFDPGYPRSDLPFPGGDAYVPMFNGGNDPLPFAKFYMDHNANDNAVNAIAAYKLGTQVDPKKMRRGDMVEISWFSGFGHGVFCWDVHLNDKGDVDCFQYLGANGGAGLFGVTISGCNGKTWLTGASAGGKKGTGSLKKAKGKIFVDGEDILAQGQWLVLPGVPKGSVDLTTFKVKPKSVAYPAGGASWTAQKIRVGRFNYKGDPPAPWCMKDGTAAAGPPGHLDAPITTVAADDLKKDPRAVEKVAPQPAPQEAKKPAQWQIDVEHALHDYFTAGWIDKDPGESTDVNDDASKAAIKAFQTLFGLDVDGIAGKITRGKLGEQRAACKHQHEAQEILGKLFKGNKLLCDPGPADGKNSKATKDAVLDFQRMWKLDFTGVPDVATQKKLQEALAENAPTDGQQGLAPAIDQLYWLGNDVPVGGAGLLKLHSTDLMIGHDLKLFLKSGDKEVESALKIEAKAELTEVTVPLPAADYPQGAQVQARVTAELEGGKSLEKSTAAPVIIGAPAGKLSRQLLLELTSRRKPKSVKVFGVPGKPVLFFRSKMSTDYDGAPMAYHKDNAGSLDVLGNAHGLATDQSGALYVQQEGLDPAPGFYVSPTALSNPALCKDNRSNKRTDPRVYLDATKVPYISLPSTVMDQCHPSEKSISFIEQHVKFGPGVTPVRKVQVPNGAVKGDLAAVIDAKTKNVAYAILGEVGPPTELGEGSPALNQLLGRRKGMKNGRPAWGDVDWIFVVFVGSRHKPAWPVSNDAIASEGAKLLSALGGVAGLEKLGMFDDELKAWQA